MEQPPFAVAVDHQRVDAWSLVRLPFEPRGWLRDYRGALQRALRAITPSPTGILVAEYGTPDDSFVDLENVLLYNVGTGCYAHLAKHGIVCQRKASVDDLHRVTYSVVEPAAVISPSAAGLASAQLTHMPTASTPAHWWADFRTSLHVYAGTAYDGRFGIEVDVGSRWDRDLASSIKPMLDGLVAALHAHDGSERDHVSAALSCVGEGGRLWTLLNDPNQAIFGKRRLVRPHGTGIAWNPADERCDYFAVIRRPRPDALSARIVTLMQ
ncbi:hypothetical protein [Nocardioides sp. Soil805]|uniref:hypothetical protein n=1 Tax=Nocardioides sp. Soil805 TaxID=1736416 RepID=UPI000702EA83|nr:hypothetical protein [Nocardioides sp. Soil805]KRF34800.1 hypothetical protein ASG94_11575 [Nocardioides sp. Soil805]